MVCASALGFARSACAADDAAPPRWLPPATVGVLGAGGWTDGPAGRVGAEAKGWLVRSFGLGGKAMYGQAVDSPGSTTLLIAEPEIFVQLGSPTVRWLSFLGAELGAFQDTHRYGRGIYCIDPCPPPMPPSTDPWAFLAGASIGTGVEGSSGWVTMGANLEFEANLRGFGGLVNLLLAVNPGRF
jgi:hypothetical protein